MVFSVRLLCLLVTVAAVSAQITVTETKDDDCEAQFYNHHAIPLIGFWADLDGNLHRAFELAPGENVNHATAIGHVFEVQSQDGESHGSFSMRLPEEQIHIWPDGKEPGMVDVHIDNQSGKNVMMYYLANVDDEEMIPVDALEPGQSSDHGAWRDQLWVARDEEGNDLLEVVLADDVTNLVIPAKLNVGLSPQ